MSTPLLTHTGRPVSGHGRQVARARRRGRRAALYLLGHKSGGLGLYRKKTPAVLGWMFTFMQSAEREVLISGQVCFEMLPHRMPEVVRAGGLRISEVVS